MCRAAVSATRAVARVFVVVVAGAAVVFAACASVAFAQSAPRGVGVEGVAQGGEGAARIVVEHVPFPNFPVEIVGVEVAGAAHDFAEVRPRVFGVAFDAREGWLPQLAFRIRNKTDKALVSAQLYGTLAAGEEGEVPMGIEALYGRELDESAFTGRAARGEPRRLAPGETAEVRWPADEYERMVKFLASKRPLAAYRRMRIDLREARFEDGTVWSMGRLYQVDPHDPRKWTPLDARPAEVLSPNLKPGERLVEIDTRRMAQKDDSDALAVTEIKVNGQSVTPGLAFAADADWLRGLTVRVRNESAKPIASVTLSLGVPEGRYRAGDIAFRLRYETRATGGEGVTQGARVLQPGEEAELSFTEREHEANRGFAERFGGITEIARVRVGMASVVFTDGTKASVGKPVRAAKPGGAK